MRAVRQAGSQVAARSGPVPGHCCIGHCCIGQQQHRCADDQARRPSYFSNDFRTGSIALASSLCPTGFG